jgi:hypothetical protein
MYLTAKVTFEVPVDDNGNEMPTQARCISDYLEAHIDSFEDASPELVCSNEDCLGNLESEATGYKVINNGLNFKAVPIEDTFPPMIKDTQLP